MLTLKEVNRLAQSLQSAKLDSGALSFGSFFIKAPRTIEPQFVNSTGKDYLNFTQQYAVTLNKSTVTFCIQLYLNTNNSGNKQYRLSCFSSCKRITGLLFTINLSNQKEAAGQIFLTSKLSFTQQPAGHHELTDAHRRLKQELLVQLLERLDFDVESNDILLGIFDTKQDKFLTTTPNRFLHDFLTISILKGHFMANKGYQIELLPSFELNNKLVGELSRENKRILPPAIQLRQGKRTIPLSLRYKVLHRDKSRCVKCGKTPEDAIKLHIDHITPFSRGGLSILSNLRTLCSECNIGRSNNYND